jgi:TatD DNase family protein
MQIIDSHCHIHDSQFYIEDREAVYARAINANVKMILIGTSERDSREAVEFAAEHTDTWAVIGVHPHGANSGWKGIAQILQESHDKVIGIGEIGLDYFYDNSPRSIQLATLEAQLQLARDYDLPVSFHVREAFGDFWPILANFPELKGVLHSFTDTKASLEVALSRGLYIGVNGISTFANDKQDMWDMVPLESMLLETDAPFLTPAPLRGKVNEPAFLRYVASYHADRRGMELEYLARVTSTNASTLFSLCSE